MDWQTLRQSLDLAPGEKITIETAGQVIEITSTDCEVRPMKISAGQAEQTAKAARKIAHQAAWQLAVSAPDAEEIKKLAEDLIHAGEYLKKWAAQ